MKKNQIIYLASSMLLAGGLLASCGGNKKAETLKEEATREVFVPDEKETAVDTLQQIDEMVEAVETPVNGINGTKYDAAFFRNAANKGDKATADKYYQTSSGLKYVIAQPGSGKTPKATDTVTVHYVGTLTDGTQFDSSIDRGESIAFPLGGVIPGWTEGLQYMQEGGVAVFYIPSNLAYGSRNLPGIPADSDLIFWVQLLQVN
ncbi:MAG: FKBP-type peptidyl-prolyl cis-trans isomerase [Muribaculaceae bacterium]|nr:FKBP-type peptidyl-prolyl cis-trans isomerase [Muribaculaceae bacterium]